MRLGLVAVALALVLFSARAASACGAPVVTSPGKGGTALFEGEDQVSAFAATDNGVTWLRMRAPDWQPVQVLQISGELYGNIETDARVETAISNQNGSIVEISEGGALPISAVATTATTVFGAALDAQLHWQVLAYQSIGNELGLFSETSLGSFAETAHVHADCGAAEMLDLVVENDGTLVGICGGQAVTVSGGTLQLTALPIYALALGRSTAGTALFYGNSAEGSEIDRVSRAGSGFAVDASIPSDSAVWFIAVNENSVVAANDVEGMSATTYTFAEGNWSHSDIAYFDSPLVSASGSPAQMLAGQYQLDLYTQGSGQSGSSWTTTQLATIGIPPEYEFGGCASAGPSDLLALFGLALGIMLVRLERRQRELVRAGSGARSMRA